MGSSDDSLDSNNHDDIEAESQKDVQRAHCSKEEIDDDPIVETPNKDLIQKSLLKSFDIRNFIVKCTSCGTLVQHTRNSKIKKHRRLGVLTCNACYDFYGSSDFSQDEEHSNKYCTWCGNGGNLLICDFCPNGFCTGCIRRNFGRAEITEARKDGWKCYCCDSAALKPKIALCDLIIENNKRQKSIKRNAKLIANNTVTKEKDLNWLLSSFDHADMRSRVFRTKLSKLRTVFTSDSKSPKFVFEVFKSLLSSHRSELKQILKDVIENSVKIEGIEEMEGVESNVTTKSIKEVEGAESCVKTGGKEMGDIDSSVKNQGAKELEVTVNGVKNQNSKNICKKTETSDNAASDSTDASHIDLVNGDSNSLSKDSKKSENIESNDENLIAKNALLQCTVESENSENELTPQLLLDDQCKVENKKNEHKNKNSVKNKNIHESGTDDSFTLSSKSMASLKENIKTSVSRCQKKVKLSSANDSDSTSMSSLSSVSSTKPQTKSRQKKKKVSNNVDSHVDKLKLIPKVILKSCDHLLPAGQSSVNIAGLEDIDKLEKFVDNLHKFPKRRPKTHNENSTAEKKNKSTGKKKTEKTESEVIEVDDNYSDNSIIISSDEEETKSKKQKETKPVDLNELAKKELTQWISSSSDASSDNEVTETKKKKSTTKKSSDDDLSDFKPKKKKKYDNLLHCTLLSDNDSKSGKTETKRRPVKRKLIRSDDEAALSPSPGSNKSAGSNSDEEKTKKKEKPKKRRRIRNAGSSSSDKEESDSELKNSAGMSRKNLRKILPEKKLADETKEAQQEEKERKKRIQERQKLYNKIEDVLEDGHIVTRKMVLEIDPESKEEIVEINPDILSKLKPHQVNGVKFMWECTVESVKKLKEPGSGCILAHCMGLGKTLQVIAFLHTCMTNKYVKDTIKRAMVICPYNTVLNWVKEFETWLEDVEGDIKIHQLAAAKDNYTRLDILQYWFKSGGVCIVSYDIFRRLSSDKIPKFKVKSKALMHRCLLDPGPDIVICDEGHVLKNESSAISKAMAKLQTKRRIVLTGTPLQNNLKEYHCMLSFVKPHLLGTMKEFRNRFVNPIINGQYDDSSLYDVKLMKKRIHILHKLLDGCVQRCDYGALTKFLPPKHEFVISVKLSDVQIKMYKYYLDTVINRNKDTKIIGATLFTDFNNLRCIWTHPSICRTSFERAEYRRMMKDDDEEDDEFINDETTSSPSSSDEDSEKNEVVKNYKTRSRKTNDDDDEITEVPQSKDDEKEWFENFISEEDRFNIELSGKMVLIVDILKECELIGDKVLLFSQSLLALDLIEDVLTHLDQQPASETDKVCDITGRWVKGLDYFRMDGATNVDNRKFFIENFNDPDNDRARLFLISTRAGSLGTNLVGANRVILLDTSWNPSHDVQAIFRVYRFGQIKPVYIYRLIAQGTMEEKIYDRQVTKLSLSIRVVDEQQIDRHFSAADLAELYTFNPEATSNRPTPLVPKDRLLAEMLIKNKDWIVTYHEHDSLLQNETEEDLTEEERQLAWTEYENEREGLLSQPEPNINMNFAQQTNAPPTNEILITYSEPDFNQADYSGRMIPEMNAIIRTLSEKLSKQFKINSLEFVKQMLVACYKIRTVFQEKQVKVLRKKQEFFQLGSIPNSVKKYEQEVSTVLVQMGNYINTLQNLVNLAVQQAAARATGQPQTFSNMSEMLRHVRAQNISMQRPRFAPSNAFPQTRYSYVYPAANNNFTNVTRPSSVPSTSAAPIITETDDSTPTNQSSKLTTTYNNKSSVTIEEIQ